VLPSKVQLAVGGIIFLYFVAFLYAPVVPYVASVSIPDAFRPGFTACLPEGYLANYSQVTPEQRSCLDGYLYPAAHLTGYATPAYRVLGSGDGPFASQVLATEGNYSALLFFSGTKLVAAEDSGPADVSINPVRTVEVESAPIFASDFGFLNISIQIRNVGYDIIEYPSVYLSMVGYSTNTTSDGLTWIQPHRVGVCSTTWSPGEFCAVSQVVENQLPMNQSFNYYVEIRGFDLGKPFIYRQGFQELYPQGGVGPLWVSRFVGVVNGERTGLSLVEDSLLDQFASIRFNDSSSNYQISDYGFISDAANFFGQNGSSYDVEELILYPGAYSPSAYASFLSTYAPRHWSALTDPTFTHFGFYVGHAPYYSVFLPCSVYEIPGPNINVTHYFQEKGCRTTVQPGVAWLVLILSP
jgi:hypothetical protein